MMTKYRQYAFLMRLHKPLPILLSLWPTYWALWVAANGFPPIHILIIFTLGVLLTRSAGCIFNDLADRDFDGKVARTQARPLATGEISVKGAITLATILCLCAFLLVLLLNTFTILLSFIALGLMLLYPLMKRVTHLPQLVLGLAFNWGIIMAFAAINNTITPIAWYLYLIAILWTVAYDTQYALEDRIDDVKIGIRSTAILFGRFAESVIVILQCIVLGLLVALGLNEHAPFGFYIPLGLSAIGFVHQYYLTKQKHYIKAFSNNHWVGLLIFISMLSLL